MKGFDPKFSDFPDFILRVTRGIWEDRGITTLQDHYVPDIVVRAPGGITVGHDGLMAATMATLAAFPDRALLGEDVIWCGTPGDGLLASHRMLCTATHLGCGVHGPATGRRLTCRIVAACHARENRIDDAWQVRDEGAIVRQLGWAPDDYARDLIAREGGPDACTVPLTPVIDPPGPYAGSGNDNAWGGRLADLLTRIMGADMAAIPAVYDRAAHLEYPGGVTGHGHDAADRFWLGLRAALPSARFDIHHRIGRDDPYMAPRAAIRWSLTGTHDGWGSFGAPTGAPVHVMGMTHAEFGRLGSGPVLLRREWTLFDETAVWKQILMHTGAV